MSQVLNRQYSTNILDGNNQCLYLITLDIQSTFNFVEDDQISYFKLGSISLIKLLCSYFGLCEYKSKNLVQIYEKNPDEV